MNKLGKIVDGVIVEHPTHYVDGVAITQGKTYPTMIHIEPNYFAVARVNQQFTDEQWQELKASVLARETPITPVTTTTTTKTK